MYKCIFTDNFHTHKTPRESSSSLKWPDTSVVISYADATVPPASIYIFPYPTLTSTLNYVCILCYHYYLRHLASDADSGSRSSRPLPPPPSLIRRMLLEYACANSLSAFTLTSSYPSLDPLPYHIYYHALCSNSLSAFTLTSSYPSLAPSPLYIYRYASIVIHVLCYPDYMLSLSTHSYIYRYTYIFNHALCYSDCMLSHYMHPYIYIHISISIYLLKPLSSHVQIDLSNHTAHPYMYIHYTV